MVLAWFTYELALPAVMVIFGIAGMFRLCAREERVAEAVEQNLPPPRQSKAIDIILFMLSLALLIGGVLYGLHLIGYKSYGSSGW
ncbi:MAG: hypothetical protein G01um101425_917 [Candidatus Peregrinibacteria bacterium Gr01-1014_25]|nr:MAG: hypothetical protein G01um101425_917 [Candidatus Peregrinibacteria bacterium Gr01-1014_25]